MEDGGCQQPYAQKGRQCPHYALFWVASGLGDEEVCGLHLKDAVRRLASKEHPSVTVTDYTKSRPA